MSSELETAKNPDKLRRIVIDPVSRVEGHGKVTLLMDEDNKVHQARLHIVEFRGFERFIQGRPYAELPVLVQRLCGICPVSHHIAAGKAIDQLVGVDQLTPSAEKLRRLLHLGQVLQSHALHFFHLASPDLLFGMDSEASKRNIFGLLDAHPDIAIKGVKLRKFGQQVIEAVTGKRIHGTGAIPGGMNKSLTRDQQRNLQSDIDTIITWAEQSVDLARSIFLSNATYHRDFARIDSNFMSLIAKNGALDLYHGGLRVIDKTGEPILDHIDYREYSAYLREDVKSWTYMKFPYIESLGNQKGWYRVGPLARLNSCDFIATERAESCRQVFKLENDNQPMQSTLAFHWARMIELLYCAEAIKIMLNDPDIVGTDLITDGEMCSRGIGVIEAPRGTLFHDYRINDNGLVVKANLIVSTTNNNQAMNESVRQVASTYLDGQELTDGLLNRIEVAIRAYDPCLSCATHALGKMPLQVELVDAEGELVHQLIKSSDGEIQV